MNSSFWISIFIQRKDGKKVMNYKIVEQVSRKKKSMSGVLRVVMIIFAVLFVVMGITISQAFMLPGFLLAGLYFVFDIFSQKDYEYMMENGQFEIDVIYGKKYRKTASNSSLCSKSQSFPGSSLIISAFFNLAYASYITSFCPERSAIFTFGFEGI